MKIYNEEGLTVCSVKIGDYKGKYQVVFNPSIETLHIYFPCKGEMFHKEALYSVKTKDRPNKEECYYCEKGILIGKDGKLYLDLDFAKENKKTAMEVIKKL